MSVMTYDGLQTRLMVGMEIHVELATRSKMFTSAPNIAHPDHFDAEPNTLLDPVVIGMPGTLPVINRAAVDMSLRVGLALGCRVGGFTKWDRKSYYYPDLPKNYQISQYDYPLCGEGALTFPVGDGPDAALKTVRILRAHLEEDAGKLLHEAPGGGRIDYSIVDLNRAGTPLLEIVTEPDITSPAEAVAFCTALRDLVRHLGVSEAVLQRGQMRFEPNINVVIVKDGKEYRTPIVEIKNLNSFRAVEGSIAYEYERQVDEWLSTGKVMGQRAKTTRGWDDGKQVTTLQRHKEDADEYRYFPDPDLVSVVVDDGWLERLRSTQPETPLRKRERYATQMGLNAKDITAILDDPGLSRFFESVVATGADGRRAAAVLRNFGAKRANEQGCGIHELGITATQVRDIIALADSDRIGSSAADELFGLCCGHPDRSAEELATERSLLQVSDTGALEGYVEQVLAEPRNAKAVADIRAGKDKAIGALLGQIMKLSKGAANPKLVTELIRKKLS